MDCKILNFGKIEPEYFNINDNLNVSKESLIYGEVNHKELFDIISKLDFNIDSILDIGSGCGKIVIYLALNLDCNVDGIEIDENRFSKSEYFLEFYMLHDKVTFINSNFVNIYFGTYDLLYCCNTIFF